MFLNLKLEFDLIIIGKKNPKLVIFFFSLHFKYVVHNWSLFTLIQHVKAVVSTLLCNLKELINLLNVRTILLCTKHDML